MEESVRSMLVYKKQAEQLRQEKTALTIAFEVSAIYLSKLIVVCQSYYKRITILTKFPFFSSSSC